MILYFMAALPSRLEVVSGVFAEMDADGNGQISAQEYAPFDDRASFAVMDQDKNSQISPAELQSYIQRTDPARNVAAHMGQPLPTKSTGPTPRTWLVLGGGVLAGLIAFWRWKRR
jgi:LPXTG-motif cell wall-anchored protein